VVKVGYGGVAQQGSPGSAATIGRLSVLHAYTEPIPRCTSTAPSGMGQRRTVDMA
jgi:hypothetical protein